MTVNSFIKLTMLHHTNSAWNNYILFFIFSAGKKGAIALDDLKKACELTGTRFTEEELKDMIEEADINGDGHVDQSEFVRIMLRTNLF